MNPVPQAPAHRSRWLGLLALVILLGACGEAHVVRREPAVREPVRIAQPAPPRRAGTGEVEVARGDTLYGIAFRNGMDFRDLAAINGIEAPYTIYVGQILKLRGERMRPPVSQHPVALSAPRPAAPRPSPPAHPVHEVPVPPGPAPATAAAGESKPPMPTPFETVPPDATASAPSPASPPQDAGTFHPPPQPAAAAVPSSQHTPAVMPAPSATSAQPPAVAHEVPPPRPSPAAVIPPQQPAQPAVEATPRTPSAAILPADVTTVGGIHWRWPATGSLLDRFSPGDATKQGVDIGGRAGDPVVAASDGVVVYSGSGLVGYGELVIIKHSDEWLSAYGHNRKRLVAEGQRVKAGQPIAEMGSSGAPRDELHFEIRRNGRPVDPLQYLPGR